MGPVCFPVGSADVPFGSAGFPTGVKVLPPGLKVLPLTSTGPAETSAIPPPVLKEVPGASKDVSARLYLASDLLAELAAGASERPARARFIACGGGSKGGRWGG
jgi:hypothetical protein